MFRRYATIDLEENIFDTLKDDLKLTSVALKHKKTNDLINIFNDFKRHIDSFIVQHPEKQVDFINRLNARYIYENTSMEGNPLTYKDIDGVINHNMVSAHGKMSEHLEVINQLESIKYIKKIIRLKSDLSEVNLKGIHRLMFRSMNSKDTGEYRTKAYSGVTSKYTVISPENIPAEMERLFNLYRTNMNQGIHPLVLGALMHEKLSLIRPFDKKNSCIARLFMNYILLKHNYYIVIVNNTVENKMDYYTAIENINDQKRNDTFLRFIVINAIQAYLYHISILIVLTKEIAGTFKDKLKGTTLERSILKILK